MCYLKKKKQSRKVGQVGQHYFYFGNEIMGQAANKLNKDFNFLSQHEAWAFVLFPGLPWNKYSVLDFGI